MADILNLTQKRAINPFSDDSKLKIVENEDSKKSNSKKLIIFASVVSFLVIMQVFGFTQLIARKLSFLLPGPLKDFCQWLALQPSIFHKMKDTILWDSNFSNRKVIPNKLKYSLRNNPTIIVDGQVCELEDCSFEENLIHVDSSIYPDLNIVCYDANPNEFLAVDDSSNFYKVSLDSIEVVRTVV